MWAPAVSCCFLHSFQIVLYQVDILGRSVGVEALMGAHRFVKEQCKGMCTALAEQSEVVRSHHVTSFGALEAQRTFQGKTLWKINQFLIKIFSSEESLLNKSMCGGLYHHQAQPPPPKIVGWRMIMCRIWKVPLLPSPVAQNWVKHLGYIQQNVVESSSLVSDSFCFQNAW